jgi:hypothetical protein
MNLSPSLEAACRLTTKKFVIFYGTWRFTRALHWSLSRVRWIQLIQLHPICLRFILILSSYLRLGLSSGSFLLTFPPKPYMHFSSPHACYMPYPFHYSWVDYYNCICRKAQVMELLIIKFSPASYCFIPLRSKHSPQHPVLSYGLCT